MAVVDQAPRSTDISKAGLKGLYVPEEYAQRRDRVRVVIVGLGHIGPLGRYGTHPDRTKITEAWDNVISGVNGIKLISHDLFPEYKKYPNIETKLGGFVDKTDEDLQDELMDLGSVADLDFKSRGTLLSEVAAKLALHDAGIMQENQLKRGIRNLTTYRVDPELADEMAAYGGTGMGGASDSIVEAQRELERKALIGEKIDPVWVFRALPGANDESATMENEIHGESFGMLGECATGGHTVITAVRAIQAGDAIAALCINAESTTKEPIGVALFDALGALTKGTDPERYPHSSDEENDGFGFAEGGAGVVLMREDEAKRRGLHIYAVISGYAATSDGYHPSFPREDGRYQKMAMDKALARSGGLPKVGVMYIRQHATGTKPPGGQSADAIEARVTRAAIDEALLKSDDKRSYEEVVAGASSIKPLSGHLLGADALWGVTIGALVIDNGDKMPGNWKTVRLLAEARRLNMIVNETRVLRDGRRVRKVMVNSFGFGGKNTSIVLEDPDLNPPMREF